MKNKRLVFGLLGCVALCVLVFASPAHADDAQRAMSKVNQLASQQEGFFTSFGNRVLYALLNFVGMGIYLIWLALSWAVITVYDKIGPYLIPIWDFSNSSSFLVGAEASVVHVSSEASQRLWSFAPYLFGLSGLIMIGLATAGTAQEALANREPYSVWGRMAMGVGLLVMYPILYSVPIVLGNQLGRETYLQVEKIKSSSNKGVFDSLLSASIFAKDTYGKDLSPASMAQDLNPGLQTLKPQDLENNFNGLWNDDIDKTFQASRRYVTASLAVFVSRVIQILLCLWALFQLVLLFMLKGSQVIAIVLNFYLGIICVAFLTHPNTRGVFWSWMKAHITVCLWGFFWALLILVVHVIIWAVGSLHGISVDGMVDPDVGQFLMPFILFAAFKKFHSVAQLADSLAVTGAAAAAVAGAAASGLGSQAKGAGAMMLSSKPVGGFMEGAGKSFSAGIQKVASGASTALSAVPGIGPALGLGVRVAGAVASKTAEVGMSTAGASLKSLKYMAPQGRGMKSMAWDAKRAAVKGRQGLQAMGIAPKKGA